jgi:hypothetical protein
MLHWERALDDRNNHATIRTGIEITMRHIRRYKHGLTRLDRGVIFTNDNHPFAFPTEDNFVRHWMPMQTVLLTRLETVYIAMKMCGLPYPPPHKPTW